MNNYKNFELFIKNNFEIISTIFHIKENEIKTIDNKTRLIKRDLEIIRLFDNIPILKTMLEDFLKDYVIIELYITEKFNDTNNEFIYKIKFNKENLKNIRAFIKLSQDKNNINVSLSFKKKNKNNFDFDNITEEIVFQAISNYYKATFLENDLKPLIKKLSHHSFALNII
jgi:hypothetical protein